MEVENATSCQVNTKLPKCQMAFFTTQPKNHLQSFEFVIIGSW
jgi:hypothetical protein